MVAEAPPETQAIPDSTPSEAPVVPDSAVAPPSDSADASGVVGQVDGDKGQDQGAQGEQPKEEAKPAVDQPISIEDVRAKVDAFRRGDTETLSLTRAEQRLLDADNDRQESLRAAAQKADEDARALLADLEGRYDKSAETVEGTFTALLEELGVDLTTSQARLLAREIRDQFGGLKGEATRLVLQPFEMRGRDALRSIITGQGLLSDREAREFVKGLTLEELLDKGVDVGYTLGQRRGPSPDSIVVPKASHDAGLTKAREILGNDFQFKDWADALQKALEQGEANTRSNGTPGGVGQDTRAGGHRSDDELLLDPKTPIEKVNEILARRNG